MGAPNANWDFPSLNKTNSTHKRAAAILEPCPSRDGKQIFAIGTKRRGELVRYDMQSHQFVPFLSGSQR